MHQKLDLKENSEKKTTSHILVIHMRYEMLFVG